MNPILAVYGLLGVLIGILPLGTVLRLVSVVALGYSIGVMTKDDTQFKVIASYLLFMLGEFAGILIYVLFIVFVIPDAYSDILSDGSDVLITLGTVIVTHTLFVLPARYSQFVRSGSNEEDESSSTQEKILNHINRK